MDLRLKLAAAATALGAITFGGPIAYHSRDIHFHPDDVSFVTQEGDGPHLHVQNERMGEHADIRLTPNEDGVLEGQGTVMRDEFTIVVGENESVFTRRHGVEKMWLGRDVVHVERVEPPAEELNADL